MPVIFCFSLWYDYVIRDNVVPSTAETTKTDKSLISGAGKDINVGTDDTQGEFTITKYK